MDTTYSIEPETQRPIIHLFGTTPDGKSVLANIHGFVPYFYVRLHSSLEINEVMKKLEEYLKIQFSKSKRNYVFSRYILEYSLEYKQSIMGYKRKKPLEPFYKIVLAQPAHVVKARKALEYGNKTVCPGVQNPTYEANVPFVLRYMVDIGLGGCQWIKIENYKKSQSKSRCLVNVNVKHGDVNPIPTQERGDNAPIKILSFDIEATKFHGRGFPDPKEDPCITICCATEELNKGIIDKVCFTTVPREDDGCAPIQGSRVIVCETEKEMLLQFRAHVVKVDPTVITGYNIDGFDFPYLRERAKVLDCLKQFCDMSRVPSRPAYLKTTTFSSKAYGTRESYEWVCEGRFNYDCMLFMLRGQMQKLRSYKLNSVAKHFLGDEKVDVPYEQIPILYNGSDEDRAMLNWYCLKDAILPLDLLRQQMAFVNAIEQGRVTGVPIKWLLSRGQQIKTFSNVLRYKKEHQLIPSTSSEQNSDFTSGGHVEEPKRGFYKVPIGTLDFASLYPSIMCAYGICYSTKESLRYAFKNMREEDYWIPPRFQEIFKKVKNGKEPVTKLHGFCFVKKHIQEGILPRMLKDLLNTRKNVKKLMKWAGTCIGLCKRVFKTHEEAIEKNKDKIKEIEGLRNAQELKEWSIKTMLGDLQGKLNKETQEWKRLDLEKQIDFAQSLQVIPDVTLEQQAWEIKKSVFNGRQLAVKIVCNSVYGFLKANTITDKDLMSAVTDWGRWMINVSKDVAETQFTKANGYEHDAYVVYGDTGDGKSSLFFFIFFFNLFFFLDSIMVNFGPVSLERCVELCKECSAICTSKFVSPNLLEFETIKLSSLFINKKRYGAVEIEYVKPGETYKQALARGKLTLKGLESKRRDNAPIGGGTQGIVLNKVLRHLDVDGAEEYVKKTCSDILMDRVDMSQYVITKGLSKTEKAYAKGGTKQQHVELAKRIRKRASETGEMPPHTGDRVPFIMTCGLKKSHKAFELAEDPLYALRNKIPVDKDYYIQKQVLQACLRVFTAIWEPERCKEIQSNMPEKKLRTFKAYKRLFTGEHMMSRVTKHNTVKSGLGNFVRTVPKCLSCGVRMNNDSPVCRSCGPNRIQLVYAQLQEELNFKHMQYNYYWTQCQRCQGSLHKPVICGNKDCGNFYRRERVIMDIEDLEKKLGRF